MNTDSQNSDLKAWVLLGVLSLVWGSSFILIKKGLIDFSSGELATLRIFFAGIVLVPFAIRSIKSVETGKEWFAIFIVGFVGSLIPSFLFAEAETQLDSGITGAINAITPLNTLIFGALFFNIVVTKRNFIGIAIGFLGTLMLAFSNQMTDAFSINYHALYVVAATILYGLNVNIIKATLQKISAVGVTSLSFFMVLPFTIGYLVLNGNVLNTLETSSSANLSLFYIALLGVLGTAVAMILFNKLVQIKSPVFASSVTYIIPIVAIAWGLIDNEVLGAIQYLGIVIVILGVYIANKKS